MLDSVTRMTPAAAVTEGKDCPVSMHLTGTFPRAERAIFRLCSSGSVRPSLAKESLFRCSNDSGFPDLARDNSALALSPWRLPVEDAIIF